jgi:hypothetical protein
LEKTGPESLVGGISQNIPCQIPCGHGNRAAGAVGDCFTRAGRERLMADLPVHGVFGAVSPAMMPAVGARQVETRSVRRILL